MSWNNENGNYRSTLSKLLVAWHPSAWRGLGLKSQPVLDHVPDLCTFHPAAHRIHNGKVGAFATAPKANPIGDMNVGHRFRQNLQIAHAKESGRKQQPLDFGDGDLGSILWRQGRWRMISGLDEDEFAFGRRLGERVRRQSTTRRI